MVNYAQATGDLTGLEEISDETCNACEGGLDFLRKVNRHGGTVDGGVKTVVDAKSLGYSKHEGVYRDATVEFTLRSTKQTVSYSGARGTESYRGGTAEMTAVARKKNDEWTMIFWAVR